MEAEETNGRNWVLGRNWGLAEPVNEKQTLEKLLPSVGRKGEFWLRKNGLKDSCLGLYADRNWPETVPAL